MAKPQILITWDSANVCRYSFQTENGKITGMVSVHAPDTRAKQDKHEAAMRKIKSVVKEFSDAMSAIAEA